MAKLDLSLLEPYFQKGVNFELTEAQYEEKVKKPFQMPILKRIMMRNQVVRATLFSGKPLTEQSLYPSCLK